MTDMSNINTKELYGDYKFADPIYTQPTNEASNNSSSFGRVPTGSSGAIQEVYSIPLSYVRESVSSTELAIFELKLNIERNILRKIFVDPYFDSDLEQVHFKVWQEACKYLNLPEKPNNISIPVIEEDQIYKILPIFDSDPEKSKRATDEDNLEDFPTIIDDTNLEDFPTIVDDLVYKSSIPNYICFDQYIFAERYKSTVCRKFIYEFEEAIAQQTFSYIYQFRKILNTLLNELSYIRESLTSDFGEDYENDAQKQIALHYEAWAKTALHYSGRIQKTFLSSSGEIPTAELDKISQKQAAEFQAFFAIRLNAINKEVNDLIDTSYRESFDQAESFYKRFIHASLTVFNQISNPLEFDYLYEKFLPRESVLVSELIVATNSIKGNFTSVHADVIERFSLLNRRIDAAFTLIHEKRKYANYIAQLANIAVKKKKVLKDVIKDRYSELFKSIIINDNRNNNFTSNHSELHGLLNDDHPQYLLRDGGMIIGNIDVIDGVRIDGVDISTHAHNGADGSQRIKSTDIDYDTVRNSYSSSSRTVIKPISVTIDGFQSDIINGKVPVCDVIVSIEIDDLAVGNYEYEIIYTEID